MIRRMLSLAVLSVLAAAACDHPPLGPDPIARSETSTHPDIALASTVPVVSAGGYHTCLMRTDGTLACWGLNNNGQLAAPTGSYAELDAGFMHNCVRRTDATLACWGWNDHGQTVVPGGTFNTVEAGGYHTCAIRSDGTLACWGNNGFGQVTPPSGTFATLAAGGFHNCAARADGTLACWGYNFAGQSSPPATSFIDIAAGWYHTCGVVKDVNTLACWGYNSNGQSSPPAGAFTAVTAGYYHSCALRTDGSIACWGANDLGQSTPPGGTFVQVSAGLYHNCAVNALGAVTCWGSNEYGQSTPSFNRAPAASLGGAANITVNEGAVVTFALSSSDPDGDALTWTMDFGDGSSQGPLPVTSSPLDITHTYADNAATALTATVVVSDGNKTASATKHVTVANVVPTVTTFTVPSRVTLIGTSAIASVTGIQYTDPAGAVDAPYTIEIDCGNGTLPSASGDCTYSSVGSYDVAVTVTDKDGGVSVPLTRVVAVVFNFTGFFEPVDNAPTLNQVRAGSAVSVKFSLGGDHGLEIFAAGYPKEALIPCGGGGASITGPTETPGASGLSYDWRTSRYNYKWKTEKSWAGTCRRLIVRLVDGEEYIADFRFK